MHRISRNSIQSAPGGEFANAGYAKILDSALSPTEGKKNRRGLIPVLLFFAYCVVNAQEFPAFRQLRYDEDYSSLSTDSLRDVYRKIKYIGLGDAHMSVGGDFRTQYMIMDNENWGAAPQDNDGFTLNRWLLHSNIHLSGRLRVFAELQGAQANSREFLVPVQENPLEIHQFFIDYKIAPNLPITIRAGRQEVALGSERVVSLRDAPNVRRAFDGARAIYKKGGIAADAFYLHAVVDRIGIFDDTSSPGLRLWGAFSSVTLPASKLTLNLYYLGFYNRSALFNDGAGTETRHSLVGRIFGSTERWGYDVEGSYQFGTVGKRSIRAWSAALALALHFPELKYTPELGLKADIISGDKSKDDQGHQTFNPLFPPGAYFGLAAPLAPSNLLDVHPGVTLHFSKLLILVCDYALLWRYSKSDGIYRPNMTPFFERGDSESRYIGSQITGTWVCRPNKYISLLAGASWFDCGDYLEESSPGKNILYGFASAQIKL